MHRPVGHARSDEELKSGFTRQRRGLIAVSVVLVLYGAYGLRLDRLSVLGNEFFVSSPGAVPFSLAIVWLYFAVRFHQYRMDLRDRGAQAAFLERLDFLERRVARDLLQSEHPDWRIPTDDDLSPERQSSSVVSHGTPDGRWLVEFSPPFTPASTDEEQALGNSARRGYTVEVRRWTRWRAWLWVAANTRFFSEYVLPYVIACLPLISWVYRLTR